MASVTSEQGAETHAVIKSQPVALEVPVVATGARPGDQSQKRELFTEATETVLVFENGAVIRLSAAVTAGQLLFLTNKNSGKEIVTQVLRKRSFKPTACYVELEFTEAAHGFWGVQFPAADSAAKPDLPKGSVAAELAEAELAEEEPGAHAPPPDAAEVAKLRQEVEALKAQLKSLAPAPEEVKPAASEKPQETKPAEVKQEVKPALMSPNEPAPEVGKQEVPAQEAVKPAASQHAEQGSSYPIRMQLPKSEGTSNRTTEFAADGAAAENLLPKPSLDFAQYPGSKEPSPKLYSRGARRGLGGPIGVLVLIVLLLVASGILTYRLGWFSKGSRSDANAAMFPVNASNANGKAEPASGSDATKADEPPDESNATTSAHPEDSYAQHEAENQHSDAVRRNPAERPAPERKSSKRAPIARENVVDAAPINDGVVVPPKLVKSIRSLSPPEALRGYVSGNVKLDALVDETGHVKSATVISGPRALHDKAIETVKQYEYQPATKNGKPVPAHVQVTIKFWYEP